MTRNPTRRSLLTAALPLAGAAPARAQAPVPRVGILAPGIAEGALAAGGAFERFVHTLRELGWTDGRNIRLEWRFDPPPGGRFVEQVAELVVARVDVIVAGHSGSAMAARRATTSIPIVMAVTADPVADGLVTSMARPGGNLTGMSIMSPELTKKRLQLLAEALPGITRVALLVDSNNARRQAEQQAHEEAAGPLGLKLVPVAVAAVAEYGAAFESARRQQAQAVVVMQSVMFGQSTPQLAAAALASRLPAVAASTDGQFARAGGLMSYGVSITTSWQGAAAYVDRILKGAKPGELPIQQPSRFELAINAKTAQTLGLTLPPHLLLMADEVVR